jgi:KUP system potassium uptake protein
VPPFETSYFLSRETVVPTRGGMALARAAVRRPEPQRRQRGDFFRLPDNAVVELGTRVQI